jgi:hypothetical protein
MMPTWPGAQSAPSVTSQATPASYAYPANPAYTTVPVRQGFSQYISNPQSYSGFPQTTNPAQPIVPTASAPPPANSEGKVDWPEPVRRYVQRSFLPENEDPSLSPADVRDKLKFVIGSSKEDGTMYTKNWADMPLPQSLLRAEREAKIRNGGSVAPTGAAAPWQTSKKRKSSELAHSDVSQNSWRSTNTGASLTERISFASPEKRAALDDPLSKTSSKFQKDANKRKRRFENEYRDLKSPSPPPPSSGPIVGTCEVLEKKYLRLTAPPVASKVRPERILRSTLDLLKKKWRKESNYSYICDQFKSMRQDLTVQRIKNDFTVSVYEIHARIALEKGDIGEYNQCQTQLRSLYALGLKGNPIEFKAYRILYFIHTANRNGLNDSLADLTPAEKEELPIKHALDVRSALALGNYHRFFQLYLDTPNMGAYLMDMFVVRERLAALCNICKAYKPDVKLRFVTEELGFESDADAAQFICDQQGQDLLEDRTDYIAFLTGKAGPLFEAARSNAFQKVDIKGQI